MQESTLQQVAAACIRGLSRNEIVSRIDLDRLTPGQRSQFLITVSGIFGVSENVEVIDNAVVVFHGMPGQIRRYIIALSELSDQNAEYLKRNIEALRKVLDEQVPAVLFQGLPREVRDFLDALHEAAIKQGAHFAVACIETLQRKLTAA
jgi:hypothetical protein